MAGRKGGYPGKEVKKPKQSAGKTKGLGSIVLSPIPAEVVKKKRTSKAKDTVD